MKRLLRDLIWILPASLALGAILALPGPGMFWIGWLGYGLVLALGLLAQSAIWRSTGSSRLLLIFLLLAVFLRLVTGIFFTVILPVHGNDTFIHKAGYVFRDAYTYDNEGWELAVSDEPIWRALDKSYEAEDQYRGLLFTHALAYRLLSPDAHRPWLIILFSAFAGALSVGLAWKGARRAWGEGMAHLTGGILAFYPEAVLVGSSQVREPFLVLFICMAFMGLVSWLDDHRWTGWLWVAGSLVGLMLFSPAVVIVLLAGLGGWTWLRSRERRINRWLVIAALAILLLAAVLLGELAGGALQVPGGPLENLFNWLRYSSTYLAHLTEVSSGWLQTIFTILPNWLRLPFITAYGVLQPVLPAAIADPAAWPVRVLGILRGLGWYALLPLLVYSLRSTWKMPPDRERNAWLWLWIVTWLWMLLSAARAGGDQWDNPRYRVILVFFQAALAAQAVLWQRQTRDRWLGRLLAVEGVFLVLFGYWYASRYTPLPISVPHVMVVMAAIVLISLGILLGGWLWDRRKAARLKTGDTK